MGKDDYIARTMTLAELATGGKEQVEKNRWITAIRKVIIPACRASFFDKMHEFYTTSYIGKKVILNNYHLSECFRIENFNGQMLMEVVINALKKKRKQLLIYLLYKQC